MFKLTKFNKPKSKFPDVVLVQNLIVLVLASLFGVIAIVDKDYRTAYTLMAGSIVPAQLIGNRNNSKPDS